MPGVRLVPHLERVSDAAPAPGHVDRGVGVVARAAAAGSECTPACPPGAAAALAQRTRARVDAQHGRLEQRDDHLACAAPARVRHERVERGARSARDPAPLPPAARASTSRCPCARRPRPAARAMSQLAVGLARWSRRPTADASARPSSWGGLLGTGARADGADARRSAARRPHDGSSERVGGGVRSMGGSMPSRRSTQT